MNGALHSRWPRQFAAAIVFLAGLGACGQMARPAFDVAAIHEHDPGDDATSTFVSLGSGDGYKPTGGLFVARNYPLLTYFNFAYRSNNGQDDAMRASAPRWVLEDRFDIEARTENAAATKDQLRLMMRSLLADRFGLVVHPVPKNESVYELQWMKPGVLGKTIRPHPDDGSCAAATSSPMGDESSHAEVGKDGFPMKCGSVLILPSPEPGHVVLGGRNVSMEELANQLTRWGSLDRTVVDQTTMSGTFDFRVEFILPRVQEADPDLVGPSFTKAFREQLGLRVRSHKASIEVYVLDRVHLPTPN